MKADWGKQIFEAMTAPYTAMIGMSAYWIGRRKIALNDTVTVTDGKLSDLNDNPNYRVNIIKGTTSGNRVVFQLQSLSDNTYLDIEIN